MKVHRDTAIRMRYEGYTLAEIGKKYGTSREWIRQILADTRTRKCGAIFDSIPYKGLYKLFQEQEKLSIPKFARLIWKNPVGAHRQVLIKLFDGSNPKFTISEIKQMCAICGMTFEETFERRDGNEGDA